jgi:hypothetical protein
MGTGKHDIAASASPATNTRALKPHRTTAALQRGLRLTSLTLARGQKRATVTVTVFEGLRSRTVRILVRG